jgi:hypothetical protein
MCIKLCRALKQGKWLEFRVAFHAHTRVTYSIERKGSGFRYKLRPTQLHCGHDGEISFSYISDLELSTCWLHRGAFRPSLQVYLVDAQNIYWCRHKRVFLNTRSMGKSGGQFAGRCQKFEQHSQSSRTVVVGGLSHRRSSHFQCSLQFQNPFIENSFKYYDPILAQVSKISSLSI